VPPVQTLPVHVQPPPPPPPPLSSFEPDGASAAFLDGHLRRLRALPAHGNRVLHLHQLFVALLLSFYNPAVRSLRLIEDQGDFNGRLDLAGIDRLARSTTADALAAFDPAHLKPIIDDLRRRVGHVRRVGVDDTLAGITRRIIAGDGTYLNTLADVAWALRQTRRDGRRHGQVRLNVQLDVATWTPEVVSVSGDDGCSEPRAFAPDLLEGVLYVVDRNFVDFAFLRPLLDRRNDVVLRTRGNAPATLTRRVLPVTPADAGAGVVSDQIVTLTGRDAPAGEFRLVVIHTLDRKGGTEIIRLLTSLTDADAVSARVIGEVYRRRWQIELFFKWLKTWAGLDHLLSTSRNGITFQFYVAVIAVLLMYVQLGRRVSRYALVQLQLLAHGQVTLGQVMRTLARRERERALARRRAAERRAMKKLA
jgi:IS4 transposase